MRRVSDKCFANRDVHLDGYDYVGCSFQSCRFVYSGRRDFSLIGNSVSSNCILDFRDRAANTVAALADLHELGDWGRKRVIATLGEFAELAGDTDIPLQ